MSDVNNASKSYMYKHLMMIMSHYNLICQNLYIVSIRNLYVSYVFRLIVYVLKLVVIKMTVPFERRICPMCKSDVEDEYHFMLKCPA